MSVRQENRWKKRVIEDGRKESDRQREIESMFMERKPRPLAAAPELLAALEGMEKWASSIHDGLGTNRELLLIRGLPGSGKTTMAKEYAKAGYVHCEADQYFEVNGEYRFDSNKLRTAHDDCLRRAIAAMDAGRSVVVANTFTRRWEMEPYLKAAKRRGINVRIVEATGSWPNVHGVPANAIERMRARWEPVNHAH